MRRRTLLGGTILVVAALGAGFTAFQLSRRRILVGILAAELVIGGWALVIGLG